jgi:hypothetical protein
MDSIVLMRLLNTNKYATILSITKNQHLAGQAVLQSTWGMTCVDV